ncbi:MAG: TraB/GumN family protein [Gammaproteobacteria bacterium]
MESNHKLFCLGLLGLLFCSHAWSDTFVSPECRPLEVDKQIYEGPTQYNKGLLWKVGKAGTQPSYLFGTIHVADDRILNLPAEVNDAIHNSSIFVMEALPDPEQALTLINMMYFNNRQSLHTMLSKPLFDRAVEILGSIYHLPEQSISMMKPWAAFLIMNYPPETGTVLDVELLQIAQAGGAELSGLETLEEQGRVLNDLTIDAQIRLLTDTICHYDVMSEDFEKMKSFYLARDLKGLFEYSHRYSISNDAVYEELLGKLLTQRNYRMTKRMQSTLQKGNAFIAIGAMHLPGKDGVLNLLKQRHYDISLVY